jgi:hypothetical protein
MKRISSKGDSKKIILRVLSWIRYAKRPLLFDELREVIWVEEGDTELKTTDINDFSLNHIIRNCESLWNDARSWNFLKQDVSQQD